MLDPTFESRQRIEKFRGRPFEAAEGLWCCGALDGLARACVAIVGTRAATPYGQRLAYRFGAALGEAGCCVVSGLALGIDGCAHDGALSVTSPTVGVLGGGHRHFFPARNRSLADRMLVTGGAVLSPFAPDEPARPPQFLQRNSIVAALADAVVVIEAPARSGALNTAGWAAGRIPVLAVPGDVDRKHVQGCLALIRDGAILARSPEDVLEVIGHPMIPLRRVSDARQPMDPVAVAVLQALDSGATAFEEIVAQSAIAPAAALAALALLELDGLVTLMGASTYARVTPGPYGEQQRR